MLKFALLQLAKGSLIYGIGGMMQRFMVVLLLPLFTEVLTPQDYGVVSLVSLVGIAMTGFLSLGTANSMGVLYFRETEFSKRPSIIWTNVLLLTLNGILWYTILFLLASILSIAMFQSDIYKNLIRLALLGSVMSIVAEPFLAYLRMEQQAMRYIILTLITSGISTALAIWLVLVQRLGPEGVILASTLTNCIMLIISILVVGTKLRLKFDFMLFKPLVRIGFPSIFGLLAFLIIDYADRQMIERMISVHALGIYSIGCSFGFLMNLATGAFATSWSPFFMSYINKKGAASLVFAKVMTYYMLCFGVLTVSFFVFAKPIVMLMTAQSFHQAHLVVGLVAAGMFLKGCYLITLPGIYFAERLHNLSLVEWIAAIINIGLNLFFIPKLGILGAALATFVCYLSMPLLAWRISRSYLSVNYEWIRLGQISSAVLFTSFLILTISSLSEYGTLLTLSINSAIFVVFLITLNYFVITPSERKQLWVYLR